MSVIRSVILLLGFLTVAVVLGAILGGVADTVAADLTAGTPLGPHHPDTALAWTGIGAAVEVAILKVTD